MTGIALNDKILLAIGTITKMFVGELVETGEGEGRSESRADREFEGCLVETVHQY